jgi:hypothetical protein
VAFSIAFHTVMLNAKEKLPFQTYTFEKEDSVFFVPTMQDGCSTRRLSKRYEFDFSLFY